MSNKKVVLLFRKRRSNANYSIEGSFEAMVRAFPKNSHLEISRFVSSYLSCRLVSRVKAMLEARAIKGDVFHVTGDVHYLVLALPRKRTILTIHDCAFADRAKGLKKRILIWFWLKLPVRFCRVVTTVSDATKKDVIRYTGCSADKIVVVPTIVSHDYRYHPKRFNDACPRILHIGVGPNKNLERHIRALAGIDCHLHIVGNLRVEHLNLLRSFGLSYSFEFDVSNELMLQAYIESDIVLFASTSEGFGMPIIEGQSVGRPVVTSNISSMPEVAGDAACLVDPYSVSSIRAGIERIITSAEYREKLIRLGLENSKRFDAGRVARQYYNIYASIAAEG